MAKLTLQQKKELIPEAIIRYLDDKQISQAQLARVSGVSDSYVSMIRNRNTHIGKVPIADKYYLQLADTIGLNIERKVWRHFDTENYMQMVVGINNARKSRSRLCIDGGTGSGKTHVCRQYKKNFPNETYVVTSSALETAREFAMNIAETVGVDAMGSVATMIRRIVKKLTRDCNQAALLIDEAEHIKGKAGYIKVIKALADGLEGKAAFVILGMDLNKILNDGAARGRDLYPQTSRRFGKRELCSGNISADIVKICQEMEINNRHVQNWLVQHVTNFGDLEHILTSAVTECAETGRQPDVELIKSLV